jgi:glycosyltransferase involved in cell wall biosynthesis
MRVISVITPTHRNRWLERAYESIATQKLPQDWIFEWVVVTNGELAAEWVANAFSDGRVHAIQYRDENRNVGALKAFACAKATGEILVELDHDDELRPGCLEAVIRAFETSPTPAMVYSDAVSIRDDGTFHTFGPDYGWTYRHVDGVPVPNSPALLPQNVARLWYSPDHVRAWHAETYKAVGGHDPTLEICDDVDLTCKLFAIGPVVNIPDWLYTYHVHGENTWLKKNKDIQVKAWEIYRKRIETVTLAHCKRHNLPAWDIGGAYCPRAGWNVVDISQPCHLQADLNNDWPFKDNSVGAFRAHDALEHLRDSIHTMNEAWRCLVPGGVFMIEVPSTDGRGAFQDPTHVSFWNINSILYYGRFNQRRFIQPRFKGLFHVILAEDHYPSQWHERLKILYTRFHLAAIKPGYSPYGVDSI